MDEFNHWPKPYLLLSETCEAILSWTIEILDEKSLGRWQELQHYKSTIPPKLYEGMTLNAVFSVVHEKYCFNIVYWYFKCGDVLSWQLLTPMI